MPRRMLEILTVAAIAGAVYAGWFCGDPVRKPKIEAVLAAVSLG